MDVSAMLGLVAPSAPTLPAPAPATPPPVDSPAFQAALARALAGIEAVPQAQAAALPAQPADRAATASGETQARPVAAQALIAARAALRPAPASTETSEASTSGKESVSASADTREAMIDGSAVDSLTLGQAAPTKSTLAADSSAPARVERSLERLDPAFRPRLDRVIERMRNEFGIEVRVVETYRSQERQEQLFEQGRTQPGPTVTWTRSSNHTLGRAADLQMVGSDDAAGYARLARVAAEEGLHTLGARDPGHVELKPSTQTGSPTLARSEGEHRALSLNAPSAVDAGGVARVARVAQVAQVAQVAAVASVAEVAGPGQSQEMRVVGERTPPDTPDPRPRVSSPSVPEAAFSRGHVRAVAPEIRHVAGHPEQGKRTDVRPQSFGEPATLAQPMNSAVTDAGASARASRESDDAVMPESAPAAQSVTRGADAHVPTASVARPEQPANTAGAPAAEDARGAEIAARVARALAVHEATANAPTTNMTLMLEDAGGATGRIRLGVRGNSVGALIDVASPKEATELANRIGELRTALERHGLEPVAINVRESSQLRELNETIRTVAAVTTQDVGTTTASSRSGESSQERHTGLPRRDQGAPEDRPSRRNQKEERK